jgi:UPF0755 protein
MRKIIFVILPVLILLGVTLVWWMNGSSPTDIKDNNPVIFVVNKGEGVRQIANRLKSQGIIKDPVVFFLTVKKLNLDKDIQAGDFRLYRSMTASEVAEELTHGTLDIWVTIPEGKRAEEIAEILQQEIPTYDDSWIDILASNEGYLFPDTYLIPKDATLEMVVNQMRNNFEEKYSSLDISSSTLSKNDIVILASLIEREAITNEEKPVISGILHNRLNIGMALQVDATIQYAKGKNRTNGKWWEPVTFEEYQSVQSIYNTYLTNSLPPGPIANPGIEAIRAAALPTSTDYFYYLHDSNKNIRYGRTAEEHNANINQFIQ